MSIAIFAFLLAFTGLSAGFVGGDGSSSDPYQISTCQELQDMENNIDASYEIVNDIDCSGTDSWNGGSGFKPIGDSNQRFAGTINGEDYEISNLSIDRKSSSEVGFLNFTSSDAFVQKIKFVNLNITAGKKGEFSPVGAIVGENEGNISDSYAEGKVISQGSQVGGLVGLNGGNISNSNATVEVEGEYDVGGLVGKSKSGVISYSNTESQIKGDIDEVGGLVGENDGKIENAYTSSTIVADGDAGSEVGGLVGYNTGNLSNSYATGGIDVPNNNEVGGLVGDNDGRIEKSYASSEIKGDYDIGGLIGTVSSDGVVKYSYAVGNVSADSYSGGLIGYNSGSVSDSYWDKESTGESSSDGGTGLNTSQMQGLTAETNMNSFDFTGDWSVVEGSDSDAKNDSYPALKAIKRKNQLKAYNKFLFALNVGWSSYSSSNNVGGYGIFYGIGSIDESNKVVKSASADSHEISSSSWSSGDQICVEVRPYNSAGEASSDQICKTIS